jgi:hypothetical protein
VTHHTEMRFSINIPNFGEFADARMVATVAVAAEQAGWDARPNWASRRRGSPKPPDYSFPERLERTHVWLRPMLGVGARWEEAQ